MFQKIKCKENVNSDIAGRSIFKTIKIYIAKD